MHILFIILTGPILTIYTSGVKYVLLIFIIHVNTLKLGVMMSFQVLSKHSVPLGLLLCFLTWEIQKCIIQNISIVSLLPKLLATSNWQYVKVIKNP